MNLFTKLRCLIQDTQELKFFRLCYTANYVFKDTFGINSVHTHTTPTKPVTTTIHSQDSDSSIRHEENLSSFLLYFHCISKLIQRKQLPQRLGLLLPNLDGLISGQGKCILKNASAKKKKKPESHSCVIEDYNLLKAGTKSKQTTVASVALILAFLNI